MNGLRQLAPDRWGEFVALIPEVERGELLEAYWRRLSANDRNVRLTAARAWCAYEEAFTRLLPSQNVTPRAPEELLALARIEAHYFRHGCFLDPETLIAGVARLGRTPVIIIHGRYDWLARLEGAWALARACPAAALEIVPNAAHSAFEPSIAARLIAATDRFARLEPWR
jgi:proline iminopeptidase